MEESAGIVSSASRSNRSNLRPQLIMKQPEEPNFDRFDQFDDGVQEPANLRYRQSGGGG